MVDPTRPLPQPIPLAQPSWIQRVWGEGRQRKVFLGVASGIALVIILTGSIAVVLLTHARPDGYLWTSSTEVAFIQFTTDSSGHISGSLQDVSVAPDEIITSTTNAFTGVQNGSQVSFTFSALGFSSTFTGTFTGDTLTLHIPDQNGYVTTETFHGASVSDYNKAAASLRQQAAHNASATQVTQATADARAVLDQAVIDANNQLSGDLSTLSADVKSLAGATSFTDTLNGYAQDWSQMQKDYQQEQSDYKQGCGPGGSNAGVVQADAGTVSADLGTIQADDGSFQADQSSFQTALGDVQRDIQTLQTDWQHLQTAVAADATGSATSYYTASDVNGQIASAQTQITASNKALSSAQSQAKQYDKEAAQMNTDAQNLANSMHC